jgi:hypothetical protein
LRAQRLARDARVLSADASIQAGRES